MFFDTHAHYDDDRFEEDREAVLQQLQTAGVALVMNIGCDVTSSMQSVRLAERHDFIYAAVGTHPHAADAWREADAALYTALCSRPKVRAIGEIGLDYYYDNSPRERQRTVFERQMQLAKEQKMPVVIHSRDACADTMEIVRRYAADVPGVFHCFSYGLETARELIGLGWYLSFTGAVTFKNARRAIEVLQWVPLSRIFIETDSPYLAPEPHRGTRNDSRNVPLVAQKIAEIKGLTTEQVAAATWQNGTKFFGIGGAV